jgi:hypothetical protein
MISNILSFGLFTLICMIPIILLAIYDIYESNRKK